MLHSPNQTLEYESKLVYILSNINASNAILVHSRVFNNTDILWKFHWKMLNSFSDIIPRIYQPCEKLWKSCRLKFLRNFRIIRRNNDIKIENKRAIEYHAIIFRWKTIVFSQKVHD